MVLSAFALFGGALAVVDNYWQADADGNWNGSWADPAHWKTKGGITAGQRGRFDLKSNQPIEVTYPAGDYSNPGELLLRGWDTRWDVTLNGTNTTYTMCGSSDGSEIHSAAPMAFNYGNYVIHQFAQTSPYSADLLTWKDFHFHWRMADDVQTLDFTGGRYDFLQSFLLKFFIAGGPTSGNFPTRRILRFTDATVNCAMVNFSDVESADGEAYTTDNLMLLSNTTFTTTGKFAYPENSDGTEGIFNKTKNELRLDKSTLTVGTFSIGGYQNWTPPGGVKTAYSLSNKTFAVTLDRGSSLKATGYDFNCQDGHIVFNLLNGSTLSFNRSVYFGFKGVGETTVNVVNSDWQSQGSTMYMGPPLKDNLQAYYPTMRANLNLTNATFLIADNLCYTSGGLDVVDSDLTGNRNIVVHDSDLAVARFHANGGRWLLDNKAVVYSGDVKELLYGWDTARLGARGFEIVCNYPYAMSQDFSDDPGEQGFLRLSGSGEKTLTSTNTTVSKVVIAGGAAVFGENASYASTLVVTNGASVSGVQTNGLTGLVLGDATTTGEMSVDFAKTIDVAGELVLANPVFTTSAAPTRDVEYAVFVADSASDETVAFWRNLPAFFSVPEGCGALFDVKEVDGRVAFTLVVRAAETVEVTLASGSETNENDISIARIDTLKATVGEGADLTFSGALGEGRFEKWGAGLAVLSNPANRFVGGFGLYEGVLKVTDAGALGYVGNGVVSTLAGDAWILDFSGASMAPLELNAAAADKPVVVKTSGDVTVRAWDARAGCVIKRGDGRLTLDADVATSISCSDGKDVVVRNTCMDPDKPLVFNDDGTCQSGAYAGLTVSAGELRLTGAGLISAKHTLAVGGPLSPAAEMSAQVGLVADGVTVETQNSPGGLAFATGMKLGETVPETMNEPYFYVTNGAAFTCHNFFAFQNSAGTDAVKFRPHIRVTDSTLTMNSVFEANRSTQKTVCPDYMFRNAHVSAVNVNISGNADLTFDGSDFGSVNKGAPTAFVVYQGGNFNGITNRFVFANGSTFRCNKLFGGEKQRDCERSILFDDSAWWPGDGDFTFAADSADSPITFDVRTRGKGLVLSPTEGVTYTWDLDLSGEGGLQKRGAGTLVLDAARMLYAGATVVEEGVLDLDGTAATNKVFGGTGTLADAALVQPTFCVTVSDDLSDSTYLTLAADVTLEGRVTVDLDRTGPGLNFDKTKPFRVLAYTGTAPNVSRWKLVGTGIESGVRGVFAAADGFVICTLADPLGLAIIVR